VSLNPDLVRTRCGDIEQAVQRLEAIRATSRDAFLANPDAQDIAIRRLLLAIEASLHLCYHVSARRLRRVPDDFSGCFAGLADAALIDAELAGRLQAMARFRNLIVHMYWRVDYGRVFDILTDGLTDLRAFAAAVARLT
jgi:uncharacterized protein YutE (UPF0331/DUF86 family)